MFDLIVSNQIVTSDLTGEQVEDQTVEQSNKECNFEGNFISSVWLSQMGCFVIFLPASISSLLPS